METYNPKALMQALAHEIRTPLSIINGYMELLDGGNNFPPAERERIVKSMREATARINAVLRAMEAGTLSLRLAEGSSDSLHVRGTDAQEQKRTDELEKEPS